MLIHEIEFSKMTMNDLNSQILTPQFLNNENFHEQDSFERHDDENVKIRSLSNTFKSKLSKYQMKYSKLPNKIQNLKFVKCRKCCYKCCKSKPYYKLKPLTVETNMYIGDINKEYLNNYQNFQFFHQTTHNNQQPVDPLINTCSNQSSISSSISTPLLSLSSSSLNRSISPNYHANNAPVTSAHDNNNNDNDNSSDNKSDDLYPSRFINYSEESLKTHNNNNNHYSDNNNYDDNDNVNLCFDYLIPTYPYQSGELTLYDELDIKELEMN